MVHPAVADHWQPHAHTMSLYCWQLVVVRPIVTDHRRPHAHMAVFCLVNCTVVHDVQQSNLHPNLQRWQCESNNRDEEVALGVRASKKAGGRGSESVTTSLRLGWEVRREVAEQKAKSEAFTWFRKEGERGEHETEEQAVGGIKERGERQGRRKRKLN